MISIFDKLKIVDIIYISFPLIFYIVHKRLGKKAYYTFISFIEKGKKMCAVTLLVGCLLLAYTFVTATKSDYSRLAKQWNRVYIVERFGLVLYQCNDIIQTLNELNVSLYAFFSTQDFNQKTKKELYVFF